MNLYRLNLDRARKEGPRHTVIRSSEIADGSCMSPKRWLGGECDHYDGCAYRKPKRCKADPPPDLEVCFMCGDPLVGDEYQICEPCLEYERSFR